MSREADIRALAHGEFVLCLYLRAPRAVQRMTENATGFAYRQEATVLVLCLLRPETIDTEAQGLRSAGFGTSEQVTNLICVEIICDESSNR